MESLANPFNTSTALLIAFACWVIFIRTRANTKESNIPLFYYAIIVYYIIRYGEWTSLPPYVVYISLLLALLLRFEFMNSSFTKFISVLECAGLACIVYFNLSTIFGWS